MFGDRAAQEAVDCVLAAQANQRLQPRDLVDVLEEVGGQALLDVADERGALAKVQDELFAFAQLVDAETSLRSALTDPAIPAERKRAVVGDLQSALRDCNEALRLRPNFVDALDSRGLVNLKSGLTKNAITDFDAALRVNPRLSSSLYGRGLAKQRNGSISEGNLDISNAKAMDPNIVQEFASYGVH